jgi:chemotaxis protein methyltransferase CheR
MTPKLREFVASLCALRAGLRVDPEKAYLIESRLAPVARREGFGSAPELIHAVHDRADERLAWQVVEAMAPASTGFFRDPAVFQALNERVIPDLVRQAGGAPVRIWSVGCAFGQEPYSLAMLAEEAPEWGDKAEIFASDLSERMLERAQAGLYSPFEVQRGLSARRLVEHFENRDDGFGVQARLRRRVRWRRVNLAEDALALGGWDLILCRYVLGALTPQARSACEAKLAQALKPGGRIVLGVGEPASDGLQPVRGLAGVYEPVSGVRRAA